MVSSNSIDFKEKSHLASTVYFHSCFIEPDKRTPASLSNRRKGLHETKKHIFYITEGKGQNK